MKTKHYAQTNGPDYWAWLFMMAVLTVYSAIALGQPSCSINTMLNAVRGDTVECLYYPSNLPLPLTYANDGYPGYYQLTGTQFNTASAMTEYFQPDDNGQQTGYFYTDFVEINGLNYGYWIPITPAPEPPPSGTVQQISPQLIDLNWTADYGRWIEINYSGEPLPVELKWCRNGFCTLLRRTILSSDTRIPIAYKWQEIRVYSRQGLIAIIEY